MPANNRLPGRLTLVISSLEAGGAERSLALLANRWADQGRRVAILTFDDGSRRPFYALRPAIERRPLALTSRSASAPAALIRNAVRVRQLRRALHETRPEAIISFMDRVNILTLLAARSLEAPVVASEFVDPTLYRLGWCWETARRRTYPLADAIVVQTASIARRFPAALASKIEVIASPVAPPPEAAASAAPSNTILGMGRLVRQKGFDLLLEAFSRLAPRRPEWRLEIVGGTGGLALLFGSMPSEAASEVPGTGEGTATPPIDTCDAGEKSDDTTHGGAA